jgi:hypothetical protein
MIAGVPWWQWALSSIAVPIVVGLAAVYAGHFLALRKSKVETRLIEHRTTYEEVLPALYDLVESDARYVRSVYHDYGSQAAEDKASELDGEWAARRRAAMATVQRVLRRGDLGASPAVLSALQAIDDRHMDIASRYSSEGLDYVDAIEEDAASSRIALEEVRKAIKREV